MAPGWAGGRGGPRGFPSFIVWFCVTLLVQGVTHSANDLTSNPRSEAQITPIPWIRKLRHRSPDLPQAVIWWRTEWDWNLV